MYILKVLCSICDFNKSIEIPKGKTPEDVECPECGNAKCLNKSTKTQTWISNLD